ncbi:MAG: lysophospholipid acyltransferase family protein [Nitrospirota bacterium]
MKRLRWFLEITGFVAVSLPVALLPSAVAAKVGEALGLLLFFLWSGRRRTALKNIERTLQAGALAGTVDPEALAKENFKQFGRSFAEVVKVYYGFGRRIIDAVEIRGIEHYRAAKQKGKGVIVITGHCGNWEVMALAFGSKVAPAAVVARAQDNPYLNKIIEKVRARYGNSVIYKKGALKNILAQLRRNSVVGILMDQAVVRSEGVVVDFLGRSAWTTKMPALLARKTGAPVVPIFVHRNKNRHVVTIYPELRLSRQEDADRALHEDTKRFSGCIEEYIKQHPEEWLWIHRRWKRFE